MFFDPIYMILMIPVAIFSFYAQAKVKSNFNKFSKIPNRSNLTGREVAELILKRNGITSVAVKKTGGWLSDHYSPAEKVLRLSERVYNSNSIAAIGIAAHEAGHAIQHHTGFSIMQLWLSFAKPASIASNMSIWLIMIGSMINIMGLAVFGFFLFLFVVVFQIITLPVEFDASNRAKKLLTDYNIISASDRKGVNSVLDSAALTYIAAATASVVQLLYWAIRLGLLGGRRND